MCGICGYVGSSLSEEVLHAMTDALQHREPDDSGHCFAAGQVVVGIALLEHH